MIQIQKTKTDDRLASFWSLDIVIWLLFGAWNLEIKKPFITYKFIYFGKLSEKRICFYPAIILLF